MKKILFFLTLISSAFILNAQQAYIGDALWNSLHSRVNGNSTQRVIVLLNDQVDLNAFNLRVAQEGMNLQQRQQLLIRQLRAKASQTQLPLMSFINNYKQNHSLANTAIQQFWLVNLIVVDASDELVFQLAQRSDVAWMDLDNAYLTAPTKPVSYRPLDPKEVGSAEIGLEVIKADKMWKLGYTGKNRISYSIDTGVWPDHPALRERFLANFFPMSQCWFPYDSELPADKTGSHGTHTLGTTLGLETATNDTIGVAFNAYWICSDPVATSMATVKPLTAFMYAYEWALNPDGDTNTFWDIPDAINNSWGYGVATDTTLCDSYASQMFTAIAAAGIANVFSAGNDGPGDTTIGIPHEINTTVTNSFTVGALDGNSAGFPIASFSSRGPSVCGGSGSLLIKPEVSAPGVDVRSAINSNGYAALSGTSMAGPHVTGAVLLLKEAFPYLSGDDLLYALYVTATDLGAPGEDNTYGMGLIDVYAAFQYLSGLHTPVPPDSNHYDAVLAQVINPGNSFLCDSLLTPEVTLYNNGQLAITQGTFHYGLTGGTIANYQWAGNVLPGQSLNIILPSVTIPFSEFAEFNVGFESDSLMHEVSLVNNHRTSRFHSRPREVLPFIEDFEQGIDSISWFINNPNRNATWDTASTVGSQFSQYSAVMRFRGDIPANQIDDLVSPSFDFSSIDSAFLKFDVAYQNIHILMADTLKVFVSTDCGQSFSNLVYYKGGTQLQTYDTVTQYFVPWRADQWRTETIDLSAFAGHPDVIIRFTAVNKRGNYLYIDNIKIFSQAEPSSIVSARDEAWQIWPNPAHEMLYLQTNAANQGKLTYRIQEIGGRICSQNDLSISAGETAIIDISRLATGIYILSLEGDNTSKRYRFIKTN